MPLLMVEPDAGSPPPELDIVVAGGEARMLRVARGQLLSVEAPAGGQVAALFAWGSADRNEWLSPHHTRVFGGTFQLRMGTRMVSNRRRPMLVVGRDSLRRHDLLLPASEATGKAVEKALRREGASVPRIADPVNLFLDSRLEPDGRIEVRPCPARPGERWTARVLVDADVVVAAGPPGIKGASADPPRDIRVRVVNRVEDLPDDLPVQPPEAAPV
jgi:uncharacterized protein YcgI (DUF1989 family)